MNTQDIAKELETILTNEDLAKDLPNARLKHEPYMPKANGLDGKQEKPTTLAKIDETIEEMQTMIRVLEGLKKRLGF